jgi:hypothetical protein
VAATAATLLAAEGLARLLLPPPRYHDAPVELDPELGFRGVPDHQQAIEDEFGRHVVKLNSQGLRGRELVSEPAPAGVSRVLFVGDSFLVGRAVRDEDLTTARVEAGLASRGRPAEVYNLATIDWGTGQQLLALRELGRPLAPDAVVLFLYPANDVINNSPALAGRTSVSAGDPIRPYLVLEDGALRVRYLEPLRALLRARSRLFATLERRVLASTGGGRPDEDTGERLRQGRAPREDFEIFRRHDDPGDAWAQAWQASFALLRAFRDETRVMGARLLVVVVPHVNQVVRNAKVIRLDVAARLARGEPLDRLLDWNLPERRLERFFRDEQIDASLLLGPLRAAAAAGETVYARDEHLASPGHALAAQSVLAWLDAGGRTAASGVDELAGAPVPSMPEAAAAPAALDFRTDRHVGYLGDGWLRWRASESGSPGGWLIGPTALAVLPARAGELVVRGWAPPSAAFPIEGKLAVLGASRHAFRIDGPGSFEVRLPAIPAAQRSRASADGYLAVLLAPGRTHDAGATPAGFNVEELGFSTPSGAARSAR